MESPEKQKYDQAFIESFSVEKEKLDEKIAFNETRSWDSIGHVMLIAALEAAFGISMEIDDVTSLSSYTKGMEILAKYGINLQKKAA
ncbi:MAG: acyl carrier protein [Deltaproteobacteria bacterium]|nr:acyl carrier protein [Deltaproteobacteria bacterium]MBI3294681.1 acyl carrier protein [Deltaproteobacteria bacterium]